MANCVDENDRKEKSKISQIVNNKYKPQTTKFGKEEEKIPKKQHTQLSQVVAYDVVGCIC